MYIIGGIETGNSLQKSMWRDLKKFWKVHYDPVLPIITMPKHKMLKKHLHSRAYCSTI